MQEIIELSDPSDDFNDDKNINEKVNSANGSIEIIDLSITEQLAHKENNGLKYEIVSEIIEDSEVYPSSPTNSRVKPRNDLNVSLNFDNNNSMELSAPMIHDDTSINNTTASIDISIRSHTITHKTIQNKQPHRGLLDNIIYDDSFSDKSLENENSLDKTFGLKTITSRWSPEISYSKHIPTRNIDGATSVSPRRKQVSSSPRIMDSPPLTNGPPLTAHTIGSLSPASIIESPPPHDIDADSHIVESPPHEIKSPSYTNDLQPKIIESPPQISSKNASPIHSGINLNFVSQEDQKDGNHEISSQTNNNNNSNPPSKKITIKPYISSTSYSDRTENSSKTNSNNVCVNKIMSKAKAPTEDIELNLPMFLDESEDDIDLEGSSPLKKKQKRSKTHQGASSITTHDIVLPLARANTTECTHRLHKEYTIDESSNLKAEYARLSKYIINAKSFTDDESKQMIKTSLQENKEAFKKANQICKDSQKLREQIIVELPASLLKILEKTQHDYKTLLEPATIQASYNEDLPMIRFLRRVDSIYDFNHDYYYPCENKIMEENEVLLYYDAKVFFQRYSNDKRNLYRSIRKLTKRNKYVILILYDLKKLKKTVELIEDYRYKERVNERLSGSQSTSPSKNGSKAKKTNMQEVADLGMKVFDIEQRIRFIDREWQIKVHTVHSHLDFLHSLPNLITLIAKKRMDSALRFMKYAHINMKSGTDKKDILKKTLHEIGRVPELKARGIGKQYHDLQQLFQDFSTGQLQSGTDGRHLLSEKMEKRLYKLFTCRDPNEVIE